MTKIYDIVDTLTSLSRLHIVPGWKFDDASWKRFRSSFSGILMCRDDFGNVYLNCASIGDLQERIRKKRALILQAHLDHPGGRLIGDVASEGGLTLYCAVWFGGYRPTLEGKMVAIHCPSGALYEACVEMDLKRFGERLLYFWSQAKIEKGASVTFNAGEPAIDENGSVIRGPALDDLINCAALVGLFMGRQPEDVIGLLTLDEERGCWGIKHFADSVERQCRGHLPPVINIDAPAENLDIELEPGSGIRIRTSDSKARFSARFTERLGRVLEGAKPLDIKGGGTEASVLAHRGWTVASLALPLRFAHNGSKEEMWCEEEAEVCDVLQMSQSIKKIASAAGALIDQNGDPSKDYVATSGVRITDEAAEILKGIEDATSYSDFLLNVAGVWNKKNSEHGLKLRMPAADEYAEQRRRTLDAAARAPTRDDIASRSERMLGKMAEFTGVNPRRELCIRLLLASNFNAKQQGNGIALSIEKMDWNDLDRILCHEIAHWLTLEVLRGNVARMPLMELVSEGLACFASMKLCSIAPHCALNVSEAAYNKFRENDDLLRGAFRRILTGSSMEIRGKRHRVLYTADAWEPFTITPDNPFNKYGYYLGLGLFERCSDEGLKVQDVIGNCELIGRRIDDFVKA